MPQKITSLDEALPDVGVSLITGDIGEGKSALAWELADRAHKNGRAVAAYRFNPVAQKLMPAWVDHLDSVKALSEYAPSGRNKKSPAYIIMDEAAINAQARNHASAENIELIKLPPLARQKGLNIILIGQDNTQPDIGLLRRVRTWFIKRPTELDIRFSRSEFKPELIEAFAWFRNMPDDLGRRSVYAVDYKRGKRGKLTNGLPSWWTEKISKAFALTKLDAAEAEVKSRHAAAAAGARGRN